MSEKMPSDSGSSERADVIAEIKKELELIRQIEYKIDYARQTGHVKGSDGESQAYSLDARKKGIFHENFADMDEDTKKFYAEEKEKVEEFIVEERKNLAEEQKKFLELFLKIDDPKKVENFLENVKKQNQRFNEDSAGAPPDFLMKVWSEDNFGIANELIENGFLDNVDNYLSSYLKISDGKSEEQLGEYSSPQEQQRAIAFLEFQLKSKEEYIRTGQANMEQGYRAIGLSKVESIDAVIFDAKNAIYEAEEDINHLKRNIAEYEQIKKDLELAKANKFRKG